LLGVLGGLAVGGILGLFVGATLLSVFFTLLKEWVAVPDEDSSTAQLMTDPLTLEEDPCQVLNCELRVLMLGRIW